MVHIEFRENPWAPPKGCETIVSMSRRVLIVDDHESFRAVARELLEEAGYVVAGEAGDAGAGRGARGFTPKSKLSAAALAALLE